MSERIVGKIAKITSDREVIINRGSEHGVEEGLYFYIKSDPITVTDPDSKEELGQVSPIRAVVQVWEVAEKFCIARTFRTKRVKVSDAVQGGEMYRSLSLATGGLGRQLQPPRPAQYETRTETLRLDRNADQELPTSESVVSVGDVVESVLEGEDIDPVTTTLFR